MRSTRDAWDEAATLESYFVDEANVCFTLYRQWIGDLTGFLRDGGVDDRALIEARNAQLPGSGDAARRLRLAPAQALGSLPLRDPDGDRGDVPREAGEAKELMARPRRPGGKLMTATSITRMP